jgi:tetratricopeptide (TPR) repeat protein
MWQLWLLLALASTSLSDAHRQGVQLYKDRKYSEALVLLQQAVKMENPNSPEFREAVLLIGQSYFMLAKSPEAIPWLEKVPTLNEANYMLGYAYVQVGRQSDSEAAFARLFGVQPGSAAGHLVAAQMMLKKELHGPARLEVEKAIALDPKIPEAHFLLGELELYRGQVQPGLEALQQELAINPNFSMAWYRLGDAYTRKQDWAAAIPHLQRAAWLNPNYSGPLVLLGKCYLKQANYSNAEGVLRKALQIDPNNSSATYLLAQVLLADGKKDEARPFLEKLKTKLKEQQGDISN